jgi:hypothetical protein
VNGVQDGSGTGITLNTNAGTQFTMGFLNSSLISHLAQSLDEVHVYNRVLLSTEVANIYNVGSYGVCQAVRLTTASLPDTITDNIEAQEAMREHAKKATMVIMIATALHAIGFGNMLPAYATTKDGIRPLTTIAVDSSEFVVSKLKDRGTHQAFGVITNAQDFLHVLRSYVEKEAEAEAASGARRPASESTPARVG